MSTSARRIGNVYQRSNRYWATVVNAANKEGNTVRIYVEICFRLYREIPHKGAQGSREKTD